MQCLHKTIDFFNTLGCCFSCKEEGTQNEPTERTHLLPGSINNSCPTVRTSESDDFLDQYPNSLPKNKKEEQSALNIIVQDTATNIIDVAAMDSHLIEPQEYNDRFNAYQHKIAQLWNTVNHPKSEICGLLKDIPNPQMIFAPVPITNEDLFFMKSVISSLSSAINEIKIDHKEDLVVPFRIP
uniref:Ragulator complex protein LAMTOR1 n=1 Tax=Culicoides sonorensis TaxID=179676 RepID=A0A336LIF4_CULSO